MTLLSIGLLPLADGGYLPERLDRLGVGETGGHHGLRRRDDGPDGERLAGGGFLDVRPGAAPERGAELGLGLLVDVLRQGGGRSGRLGVLAAFGALLAGGRGCGGGGVFRLRPRLAEGLRLLACRLLEGTTELGVHRRLSVPDGLCDFGQALAVVRFKG